MQALKMIVRPDEHRKVVIELPADFQAEEVEVIVLSNKGAISEKQGNSSDELTEEQKMLLNFPVATEEDIQFIEEKRKHLNTWK